MAIGNAVGWRPAFGVLVALMLISAVLIAVLFPATPTQPATATVATGRRRDAAAVITGDGLAYIGQFTLYTYVTVLLLDAGASKATIAPLLFLFGLFGLLGTWRAAPLLDRRPRQAALTILGLSAASMVALGLAAGSLSMVIGAAVLWNIALGPVAALFQSATLRADATTPELAGAWINMASNVGIASGALLGGAVLEAFDIRVVAWFGALPVLLALLTVIVSRRGFPHAPSHDLTGDDAQVLSAPRSAPS